MVDPLAVFIAYLLSNATVTGLFNTQIAAKHQYASTWAKDSLGLVAMLSGGPGNIDVPVYRGRFAMYCYGASTAAALAGLLTVRSELQVVKRLAVTYGSDEAMLYFCLPDSDPSLLHDPQTGMDMALQFFDVMIGQEVI